MNNDLVLIFSKLKLGGGLTFANKIYDTYCLEYKIHLFSLLNNKDLKLDSSLPKKFIILNFFQLFNFNGIFLHNSQLTLPLSFLFIKARHIYITHGTVSHYSNFNIFRKIIFKIIINLNFIDKIVCCSKEEKKELDKIIFTKKSSYIFNYIKSTELKFRKLNFNFQSNRFIFIGRICFQKGIDILIKSFELYNINNKDKIFLDIYGYFEKENKFSTNIKNLIQKNAFIKFCEEANSLTNFSSYKGAIFPSRFEGHPYSPMELSLQGLPLIISDCIGHNDIVSNNDYAVKFKNNSIYNLYERILYFNSLNKIDLEKKNYLLNQRIQKKFNQKNFKKNYDKIFINFYKNTFEKLK